MDTVKTYDIPAAAAALNISNRTVLRYLQSGKLTGRKIGRKWIISEAELLRLVQPEHGQGDAPDKRTTP